jgi:hypothetical protein
MAGTRLRKVLLLLLLAIAAGCALLFGGLYAALHSPALLARLGSAFGYEVAAGGVSVSPLLSSASLTDVTIKRLGDERVILAAAGVTARHPLQMVLRGEIDTLVLHNPRITYRVESDQRRAAEPGREDAPDLSALERVPNIRLLDVRNGEVLVTFAGQPGQVKLTSANLSVRNLSPGTAGTIAFDANLAVANAGGAALTAAGRIDGAFQVAAGRPKPQIEGKLSVSVESGSVAAGSRTVSLRGLALVADLQHDGKTDTLKITRLHGQSRDLGTIAGKGQATLRGERPWSADVSVSQMEFAQAFQVLKPFLPQDYRDWTLQGRGAVQTELQGTYATGQPAFAGRLTLSFSEGGLSSPDSNRAAQGMSGQLILKLQYGPAGRKIAFDLRSEGRDGEYLWGTYYVNLAGQTASLAAEGTLFLAGEQQSVVQGRLDLLQTGAYTFSAGGTPDDWTLRLEAADVSHARLLDTLFAEHAEALSPRLSNLAVTGTSSISAVVHRRGAESRIAGVYRMTDTTVSAPGMPLAVRGLTMDLPFDLAYPSPVQAASPAPVAGHIRAGAIARERLAFQSLDIPIRIARNSLTVPEPVTIPFYGGNIHLYGLRVDDVLFPRRYQLGLKLQAVDLGQLTLALTGTEFPGEINADFGEMTYENGRIASESRAVVIVFGGEVEMTNFFAEDPLRSSRRLGGDITFKRISLEEVTRRIAIGKMTGLIRGSLTDLVMEYGQPARFTLEIESVPARGVPQSISTDAIQSISILGTGADSPLNQGITRFFREYPYSKIGLRCVLNNDRFTVRGTIHEGGKEYLVRRGLLRGVDVVNQNPDNVISFRDMQERLQRVYRPVQADPGSIQVQ